MSESNEIKPVETKINTWIKACKHRASVHFRYYRFYNWINFFVSLPTLIFPIVVGNFSYIPEKYVWVMNLVGPVGTAVLVFNDFGANAILHHEFCRKYSLLSKELKLETFKNPENSNFVLQACVEKWFFLEMVAPFVDD